MEESLRIQREEGQYAQRKQTQSSNFAAYQLEQQTAVGVAGAEALGNMGLHGATEMSANGGMNPTGMMMGMAMGGALAQNLGSTMNNMMGNINHQGITPPPVPQIKFHVAKDGQATGPYDINTLSAMAQ